MYTALLIANGIIAGCYFAIATLISIGLWSVRARGINGLGAATFGIFLTCALGHLVHAGGYAAALFPDSSTLSFFACVLPVAARTGSGLWMQVLVDGSTVFPAVAFLALRQRYGLLAKGEGVILDYERLVRQHQETEVYLRAYSSELEARVVERTAALQVSYERLQQSHDSLQVAKQAAEAANMLKSQFLATMSHELRTPLNAIINFAALPLRSEERYGPLSERHRYFFQRVQVNGEHLLEIINDILDLAKLQAGRMELTYESVQLPALLDGVVATIGGLASDKDLPVVLDLAADLPAVMMDKIRIRQVLLNLLSNAIKFTEQGQITIRAVRQDDHTVCLSVADTGIGIAPEHQTLVFEEFRQVAEGFTRDYGGTGLGLAISKRLVVMHGGQLGMQSTPSVGTTFSFTLPIQQTAVAPTKQNAIMAENAAHGPTVVVIDDDLHDRQSITQYLETAGYVVHALADSREALTLIREVAPHAIVLDVLMPFYDGWEVLQDIRRDPITQAIPVVLCSIINQPDLGTTLGANAFLSKPVQAGELVTLLSQWLPLPEAT